MKAPLQRRTLALLSVYYLCIPTVIFLCTWARLPVALVFAPLCILIPPFLFRDERGRIAFGTPRKEWLIALILTVWVILSGTGALAWQNRWDHAFRNAVFFDLVNSDWPVFNDDSTLCYYFGFWLLPALVAKATSWLMMGFLAQAIYAIIGVWIAFRLMLDYIGDVKLRYLLPLILFSGLDAIGVLVTGRNIGPEYDLELWNHSAFWLSNTSLLFCAYNQMVPALVATMLIVTYKDKRGVAPFVLAMLFISAPFPVVGMLPLTIYYIVRGTMKETSPARKLGYIFSPADIFSLCTGAIIAIFFALNENTEAIPYPQEYDHTLHLVSLLVLEVGVFIPFIFKQIRRDATFLILLVTSILLLFIDLGGTKDFNSRVEIPFSIYLTLQLMIWLRHWKEKGRKTRLCFLLVAAIAVATPGGAFIRTIKMTCTTPRDAWFAPGKLSIFEVEISRENFVADSISTRKDARLARRIYRIK